MGINSHTHYVLSAKVQQYFHNNTNLWSYTTEYFNTQHCHSPQEFHISDITQYNPPHIKWIPRGQLYHIYPRWTLGTSQPQYEMFNYSLWFFNNLDLNILVPYDAQLQHKPSYLLWIYQKVLDNVILMTFYKFELSQVAISVLNISTCILCITTLLFAKPRDGLLIRLKLRAVGSKRK